MILFLPPHSGQTPETHRLAKSIRLEITDLHVDIKGVEQLVNL